MTIRKTNTISCKIGILRENNKVTLTFLFDDINDAIASYDTWTMDEVEVYFKGPKVFKEIDKEVDNG